ncbi:MAG: DUF4157 domain-containing protein [Oscillochloris sp.]|nr:DUF4157 domain-containing protein [Oscillochloris sp.]
MKYWSRYIGQLPQQEEEKAEESAPQRDQAPPVNTPQQSRRSGGQPLSPSTRARLEAGLGTDLSAVRLHQDAGAAGALQARAFNQGNDIVVAKPADRSDPALLSHEAAHVAQAQQRGVRAGVGTPNSASEHEAHRAADAIRAGKPANVAAHGTPVPHIQRQEQNTNPVVRREAVRLMLTLHYQQQNDAGSFKLTETVKSELRRMIPTLEDVIIERLWQPEPRGPLDVFQRLVRAGYLPAFAAEPEPALTPPDKQAEPPAVEKQPASDVSWQGAGGIGLHLTINPRPPAPISAIIRQELGARGLPLAHDDIDKLLAGRAQGIAQLETILKATMPSLAPEQRRKLAETIADTLITRSVQGQLKRELPTALERDAATVQQIEQMLGLPKQTAGDMPGLLKKCRWVYR